MSERDQASLRSRLPVYDRVRAPARPALLAALTDVLAINPAVTIVDRNAHAKPRVCAPRHAPGSGRHRRCRNFDLVGGRSALTNDRRLRIRCSRGVTLLVVSDGLARRGPGVVVEMGDRIAVRVGEGDLDRVAVPTGAGVVLMRVINNL